MVKRILTAGVLVGTLDGLFAIVLYVLAVYSLALRLSAVLRRLVQAPARAVVVGMAYGIVVWLVIGPSARRPD